MTLLLVRHASTDWSEGGRFNGWTDVPLNERGRREAAALREKLEGESFAGVWSSDLMRAVETGVCASLDPALDERLRELDFGVLEGKTWGDCGTGIQRALVGFDDFRAEGGESVDDLRRRLSSFLSDLPRGRHLVFTHGGVIRCLLRHTGRDGHVGPATVTVLEIRRDHDPAAASKSVR